MIYLTVAYSTGTISMYISQVYLTKELKFPRETITTIKTVLIPLSMIAPFFTDYIVKDRPIALVVYVTFIELFVSCYYIFIFLATFPKDLAT